MSPVLPTSAVAAAVPEQAVGLPTFTGWSNPIPPSFEQLERNNIFLQSQTKRFLEMHPNDTRSYERMSEYGILSVFMMIHSAFPGKLLGKKDGKEKSGGDFDGLGYIIQGNKTGLFLCMDEHSLVFKSETFLEEHCLFKHKLEGLYHTYYREVKGTNSKRKRWYLGLNKDGSIRCGNVTRKNQNSAKFTQISADNDTLSNLATPPSFAGNEKKCCKSKCRKKGRKANRRDKLEVGNGGSHSNTGSRRKCRTYKKWCKTKRKKFFSLKLKDLKRYYKRCILSEKKEHNGRECEMS